MPLRSVRAALACIATGIVSSLTAPIAMPENEADRLLRIAGSDSMRPLLETVERVRTGTEDTRALEIDARGSATGPPALLRGQADLASMTRPLTATERAAFRARYDREPIPIAIGLDAVALYVNAANPLGRVGREQVEAVFSSEPACTDTSPIEKWGQLGVGEAAFADRRIGVYAPPPTSGTRALFRELALCGARITDRARAQPGTRSIALAVAESRYAIGFGNLGSATPEVRALALPATIGDGFATPTPEDVRTGRYPLSRDLLLVGLPGPDGRLSAPTTALLDWILSPRGQAVVVAAGFVGLPPDRLAHERDKLASSRKQRAN